MRSCDCYPPLCRNYLPASLPTLTPTLFHLYHENQMAVLQKDNTGTPFELFWAGTGLLLLQQGEQQLPHGAPRSTAQICCRGLFSNPLPFLLFITFFGPFFRERKQAGFALQLSFKVKINAAWEKANLLDVEVLVIHGKNTGLDCCFEHSLPSPS